MPVMIKNWKLTLLAFLFIGIFTALGCWQLSRANQKKALLASFAERTEQKPLTASNLGQPNDWRFYRLTVEGVFDNEHTVLLDNKIKDGKIGYEVYTPFKAKGLTNPILVDRGFIPIGTNRQTLPAIKTIAGNQSITGMINIPPTYVAYGKIYEAPTITWPLRVEYIQLSELASFTGSLASPYILQLIPDHPASYEVKWQILTMSPEKHQGYAVQWFAFALTLLILSVALNRR